MAAKRRLLANEVDCIFGRKEASTSPDSNGGLEQGWGSAQDLRSRHAPSSTVCPPDVEFRDWRPPLFCWRLWTILGAKKLNTSSQGARKQKRLHRSLAKMARHRSKLSLMGRWRRRKHERPHELMEQQPILLSNLDKGRTHTANSALPPLLRQFLFCNRRKTGSNSYTPSSGTCAHPGKPVR